MIKIYGDGKGIDFKDYVNSKNPVIVQIGAHDGVVGEEYGLEEYLDSLESFDLYLIEPIEKYFNKLKEKYSKYESNSNIVYCNYAISDIRGKVSMIDQGGMSKITPNGSIKVNSVKFNDFIESTGISKIDLLILDCEGYEYNILKQINYNDIEISCIRYEFYWINEKNECDNFLNKNGYTVNFCKYDNIYNKIAHK